MGGTMSSIEVGDRVVLRHFNGRYVLPDWQNIGEKGVVLRIEHPSRFMALYVVRLDCGRSDAVESPNLRKLGG